MKEVFDTREYLEKMWEIAERIKVPKDVGTHFKGAMIYSALNICDAMQLLIQKQNFVPTVILLRSLFEYIFRVYWLNRVASAAEVNKVIHEGKWPDTKTLHSSISELPYIDKLVIKKQEMNDILCSYVHGGSQAALSMMGNGTIQPNIPDSDVSSLLCDIQLSSYMLLSELESLSGENNFQAEIDKITEELLVAKQPI